LIKRGIETIDMFNISRAIGDQPNAPYLPTSSIEEIVVNSPNIARGTTAEYKLLVDNVLEKAFRRDLYNNLKSCEALCTSESTQNIQEQIYKVLDDSMMSYSSKTDIPQFKDVVDKMWEKIVARQSAEMSGSMFKFPSFKDYVTIDPGEFVVFGAEAKLGKSMMLLNCAADLCQNKNKSLLYIDSELPTEAFTLRMLSHLTGIKHNRIKWGKYNDEEEAKILAAKELTKQWNFTHLYLPRLDDQTIYSVTKKLKHTSGLDVLVLDYLKSSREGDAYAVYAQMGRVADLVKNVLCGDMGIAGLGAVQLTSTGKIADSANVKRSASTIINLFRKTPNEIEADGADCGNYKAYIEANRNGPVMQEGEYIDLHFDGDIILFEEAKQHVVQEAC
jgi:hypothetical protein